MSEIKCLRYDITKSVALSASAGSGKTYALAGRVIKLIYHSIDPNQILCLTFTNKSTKEMKERILSNIQQMVYAPSSKLKELINNLKIEGNFDTVSERFSNNYKNINLSSLNIMTIDAFFVNILKLFAFEAGVSFDFEVGAQEETNGVLSDAFSEFSKEILKNSALMSSIFNLTLFLNEKNPIDFIRKHVVPLMEIRSEIDGIHLQSSNDLDRLESFKNAVEKNRKDLCAFLEENINLIGKGSRGKVKKFCAANNIDDCIKVFDKDLNANANFKKLPENEFAALWNNYKNSAAEYVEQKSEIRKTALLDTVKKFEKIYDRISNEKNILSFSDVKHMVFKLMNDSPMQYDKDYFYFKLDSRIKHMLVDEFQDTNFIQWSVLEPIVDEITSGIGTNEVLGSFFYVGDPKQSIYRFRDAESGLFNLPVIKYRDKICAETLEYNYRSAKAVVDFVNRIFSSNQIKVMGFDYEQAMPKREEEGYVYVESNENFKKIENEELLHKIADKINYLKENGFSYSDIAVLVRKNSSVDTIAAYLMRNNISVLSETTSALFYTPAAVIIISLMKYILHPQDILKEQAASYCDISNFNEKIENIRNNINILDNFQVVLSIIKLFAVNDLFINDTNLYSIIDLAYSSSMNLSNFEDFIDDFEIKLKSVNKKSGAVNENSVKIMTVHKAKGLEFNAVILPDISHKIQVGRNFIKVREDNFKLSDITAYTNKTDRFYSIKLRKIYDAEEKKNRIDELNNLYVAATRAKNALFVLGYEEKNSVFEIIKDILQKEIYEQGSLTHKGEAAGTAANNIPEQFYEIKILPPSKKDMQTEQNEGSFKSRIFGEAFHYTMEMIGKFDVNFADEAVDSMVQRYALYLNRDELEDISSRVYRLLNNREFLTLAEGKRIFKEKSFVDNKVLKRVDLMVIQDDKINIIDYKTHFDELFVNKYKKQVKNYCKIAYESYKMKVDGYIVYAETDIVKIIQVI